MTTGSAYGYEALDEAVGQAKRYLQSLQDGRTTPSADAATLRARLGGGLGDAGVPAGSVIRELATNVEGGLMRSSGGRFFGWVIGGTLPAAVAADWLTSAWDQNAAAVACSPASAVVEEIVGGWLLLSAVGCSSFSDCRRQHRSAW